MIWLFLVSTLSLEITYEHSIIFLLILSGNTELNPGPVYANNWQYRVIFEPFEDCMKVCDLIVASKQFDIFLCSESSALNIRHDVEQATPSFLANTFKMQ